MAATSCFGLFWLLGAAILEVADDVHFFVGDADDTDSVATNQVEDDMLAFTPCLFCIATDIF